jgi:predicted ribosome quality control (RQC) complex YloA/Tae2 family protein
VNILKKSLSAYDIRFIVGELKSLIIPSIVTNIYQLSPSIFILKAYSSKHGAIELLIDPKRRVNVTSYPYPKPSKPSSKCMALRRLIRRSILKDIEQIDFERVVVLTLSKDNELSKLIIEVFNGGNIILERNGRILWILKGIDSGDRRLKAGLPYIPPGRAKDINSLVIEDFRGADKPLAKLLLLNIGLPPELTREVLYRLNMDSSIKASDVSEDQLAKLIDEFKRMLNEESNPNIVETDKGVNIHPILFKSESGNVKLYRTFNEAVDDYFKDATIREICEAKVEGIRDEAGRLRSTIKAQEAKLAERYEEARRLRIQAEKLKANLSIVSELLNCLWDYVGSYGWSSLAENVRSGGVKPPLNIIKDIDLKNKTVKIEVDGELIPIMVDKSPYRSIEALYVKAKEIEEKNRKGEEALKALKERLKNLEDRISKESEVKIFRRSKAWYERFRWFISSEGFLVIAGRDAAQNEALYRRYIEANDIVLHADIHGSPLTVIKTHGRQVGEQTIIEASIFTASYSKAWRENMVVDVYWIYPNQISKTPPSGTYLGRGSFMITGRKNYVKVPEIKISIGLVRNEHLSIIYGPESAVRSKTKLYVSIRPGNIDVEAASKIVKKLLMEKIDSSLKDELIRIPEDEIKTILPGKISIANSRHQLEKYK